MIRPTVAPSTMPRMMKALMREEILHSQEDRRLLLGSRSSTVLRELKVVLKEAGGGGVPSILKEARGFSDFSILAPTYWGGTRCLSLYPRKYIKERAK